MAINTTRDAKASVDEILILLDDCFNEEYVLQSLRDQGVTDPRELLNDLKTWARA